MKKLIVIGLMVGMMLCGCAHGVTPYYSSLKCEPVCANVTVFIDAPFGLRAIRIDGFPILYMNAWEFVKFGLPIGVHSIGTRSSNLTISFEEGKEYYFMILIGVFNDEVWRIEQTQAEKYFTNPMYRELNKNEKTDIVNPKTW